MRNQPPQGASRAMAEREKNGRFAKGNSGGPGNPFAGQVAKLRAVILACLPEETMQVIVQAMIRQAMRGDVAAAKLLFQYALGKPIEVPMPAEPEGEEEAVSKREESEEEPATVSKREESVGRTESEREEPAATQGAATVNKRRETGQTVTVGDDVRGALDRRVQELFGELVELWREDTGQPVGGAAGRGRRGEAGLQAMR